MATTLPIPLTTLSAGPHVFGPVTVPTGISTAQLNINRNVGALPIDGFAAGQSLFDLLIEVSVDNQTTWHPEIQGTVSGGVNIPTRGPNTGIEQTVDVLGVRPIAGDPNSTTRWARATVTVLVSVSLSGSLVLS